jgi:hypothetical protein
MIHVNEGFKSNTYLILQMGDQVESKSGSILNIFKLKQLCDSM